MNLKKIFWVVFVVTIFVWAGVAVYYYFSSPGQLKLAPRLVASPTQPSSTTSSLFREVTPPFLVLGGKIVNLDENQLILETGLEQKILTLLLDKEKLEIFEMTPSSAAAGGIMPFCPSLFGDETRQELKFSDLKVNDQVALLVVSDLGQYKILKIARLPS